MGIFVRIGAALAVGLVSGALGGWAGLKLPDYHAHDPVGPLLGLVAGAGLGFGAGLVVALLLAFILVPPARKS